MGHRPHLDLSKNQESAIAEAKERITALFPVEKIVLFGSAVRGELSSESDIDLLIVTRPALDRRTRHQITDLVFEVNLQYGTNLSTVVVDHKSWQAGSLAVLPFHQEVERTGVEL